jgi:hypothetical protein
LIDVPHTGVSTERAPANVRAFPHFFVIKLIAGTSEGAEEASGLPVPMLTLAKSKWQMNFG